VASFVSPKWVPQMADSAEVLAGIRRAPGVRYAALTPNMKGYEGARAARADEVAVFASASEGFSKANLNCTIAESIDRFRRSCEAAARRRAGARLHLLRDRLPVRRADAARRGGAAGRDAAGAGLLRDQPGRHDRPGTPESITAMLRAVLASLPAGMLAGHYHDTGGRACDNIEASLALGLRVFDAAVGGLGGCPYAPGAQGQCGDRGGGGADRGAGLCSTGWTGR
jgi:hydroxymethylglutaryl-CoA lyase